MPCAGSGLQDFSFCSFEWAQRSRPVPARGCSGLWGKHLPVFLQALSGQALGLGKQVGGGISHFWCSCFPRCLWPWTGFHGKSA